MNTLIFIGGIHGVGKTYFCNNIVNKFNLKAYSASELISRIKGEQFNKLKRVENINKNQDILIEAIDHLVDKNNFFFLDGHFCLLNKEGRITRVPVRTFENLSPKAIIVLIESVEKIIDRLYKRDNIQYDKEVIELFQGEELVYSLDISGKLQIPYLAFSNSQNSSKVYEFIEKILYG